MAEKIFMIALSPTMEEGSIQKWLKKEGDSISSGDVLCEVETDKASMDYESAQEGILLKILIGAGESARIGDTIAVIGEKGEDIATLLKEIEATAAVSAKVAASTPLSAATATSTPLSATTAASTPLSATTATSTPLSAATATSRPAAGTGPPLSAPASGGRVIASPLAQKLASQRGIDLSQLKGSGPGGRIVKRDLENYKGPSQTTFTAVQTAGQDVSIPLSGKRAVIARRLVESKFTAPHYYVKNRVAMDNLIAARAMLNKELAEKVGFNAFMLKFAAEAMKRYPEANASWQGDAILQFASIDIGLAVDLGNGLITPIVRNVGNKGIVQIDAELKELIAKVRAGSLKPEEYSGATFSISNLGSFGVDEFTAIINPPGSAILALGRVNTVPVYDAAAVLKPVKQMIMTLSCDHRVIDGALAGRLISEMQRMMENPVRVLF